MNKIPTLTESRAIKLFTQEYGDDILSRYEKFKEELAELDEAFVEYMNNPSPERLQYVKDECSDVQGTFTHFTSLIGLNQSLMLHDCIDKVTGKKVI